MGPAAAGEAPLGGRRRGAWWRQVPGSRLLGPGRPGAAPALAVQAAGGNPAWPWLCERTRAAPGAQRALDPLRLWVGAPAPAAVVAAALWQPRRSPRGPRPWLQRTDRRRRRCRGRRHRAPWLPAPARPASQGHATPTSRVCQASGGSALPARPSAGLSAGAGTPQFLWVLTLGIFLGVCPQGAARQASHWGCAGLAQVHSGLSRDRPGKARPQAPSMRRASLAAAGYWRDLDQTRRIISCG